MKIKGVSTVLQDLQTFAQRCEETSYTDTGEAWDLLNRMGVILEGLTSDEFDKNNAEILPLDRYSDRLDPTEQRGGKPAGRCVCNHIGIQHVSNSSGWPCLMGNCDCEFFVAAEVPAFDKIDTTHIDQDMSLFNGVPVFHDKERDGNLGEVIDRRVQVYGDPVIGFAEIAEMWTTYVGYPIQAHQVPMMMLLMKVVRSKTSPDYSDHSDDIEGYLDIFRKIIGEDMIQARSVNEYIEKKWPGEAGLGRSQSAGES